MEKLRVKSFQQPCAVRTWLPILFAMVLLASVAISPLRAQEVEGPYAIGLWGDLPYSTLQATVGVPNLMSVMSREQPESGVHGS